MKKMSFERIEIERPVARAQEPSTDFPKDINRYERACRTYAETVNQGNVFRNAIEEQKINIRNVASAISRCNVNHITIVGCGDSWFAAMGVRLAFEEILGIPTEAMQALEFALYYGRTISNAELVIGISSGGNTPAVMSALYTAKEKGAITIGLTNTPESPITEVFDYWFLINAVRKGWPTQSSTATMGLLIEFAFAFAEQANVTVRKMNIKLYEEFKLIPMMMQQVLNDCEVHVKDLAEKMVGVNYMFFTGGGPSLAAAAFGAAKIKELCPIHAEYIPLEEFHHYRTLKPNDPIFVITGDSFGYERSVNTAEVGCYDDGIILSLIPVGEQRISAVSNWCFEMPLVNPIFSAIIYCLPLHYFAYYLSMAKFEKNFGFVPAFMDGTIE